MKKVFLLIFLFFHTSISENINTRAAIIYGSGGLVEDEGYNNLAHKGLNKAKKDQNINFDYYEAIETEKQLLFLLNLKTMI